MSRRLKCSHQILISSPSANCRLPHWAWLDSNQQPWDYESRALTFELQALLCVILRRPLPAVQLKPARAAGHSTPRAANSVLPSSPQTGASDCMGRQGQNDDLNSPRRGPGSRGDASAGSRWPGAPTCVPPPCSRAAAPGTCNWLCPGESMVFPLTHDTVAHSLRTIASFALAAMNVFSPCAAKRTFTLRRAPWPLTCVIVPTPYCSCRTGTPTA